MRVDVAIDNDLDGLIPPNDNCADVYNPDQENFDGDSMGDACDIDDENDGLVDTSEPASCTGNPPPSPHTGQFDPDCDDDNVSDGNLDPDAGGPIAAGPDNCVSTANTTQLNHDSDPSGNACDDEDDGDGFPDVAEANVGTNPLDNCGNSSGGSNPYSLSWPGDLNMTVLSVNKVDIQDIASFVAPVPRLNTSPGDAGFNVRWDVLPGAGALGKVINISDMSLMISVQPPMFGGSTRAFNYEQACRTQLTMGDVNCSGAADGSDATLILRYADGLPYTQNEPCPDIGVFIVAGGIDRRWGDVDCDGNVDSVDGLKILRYVGGLPYTQNEPCPDLGTVLPD